VVGKKELLAQVWPEVIVGEDSLRFHVAALRKALGDGKNGARYIETLAGRGYCFVAPVEWPVASPRFAALPAHPAEMVGRDDAVREVANQLRTSRFVTVVGAGGVGKTTVAVAVAHRLMEDFSGAVAFVDFGVLDDPGLVATATASVDAGPAGPLR